MIKIFLVEDHHIVRYGVKNLLESNPEYSVVGESDNSEELVTQLPDLKVDIVITDISMEGMSCIDLTKKIKKVTKGEVKVLILSMHADDLYINQSFEAGADGYLLKDFQRNELFIASEKIMIGDMYISKSVSQIYASNYLNKEFVKKTSGSSKIAITKRELQIIELISLGFSNKEIAEKILVSTSTVDAHRYNILRKMGVKNTAEMIMKAIHLKMIKLKA